MARRGRVALFERLEQARQRRGVHAHARVGHPDLDQERLWIAGRRAGHAHQDLTGQGELHGVGYEVGQALTHPQRIEHQRRRDRRIDDEIDRGGLLGRQRPVQTHDAIT